MIYHTRWCWVLLAEKQRHRRVCSHPSLLHEQWWRQLSLFNGFSDVRRSDGLNVIGVDGENRRVLAGGLDQVLGLITCQGALFSHSAKPWTAPWIGAGCGWFHEQRGRKERKRTRDTEQVVMKHVTTRWLLRRRRLECSTHPWAWANACALMMCRAHEKTVRLWVRTVRCSVFTPVACTTFADVCTRSFFTNRPTGKAIRAYLVVLAIDVVLAILQGPTKLSKMKMMPAIHKLFHNSNLAIPSLIAASHQAVFAFLCSHSVCRVFPSFLVSGNSKCSGCKIKIVSLWHFPGFFPSLYRNTSMLWCRTLSCQLAT